MRHLRVAAATMAATFSFAQAPAKFEWVTHFKGTGVHDKSRWIAADPAGNSYVTGEFGGTLEAGESSVTSESGMDVVVAKLMATALSGSP